MNKLIEDLQKIVDEDQQKLRDHFAGLAMQGILSSQTEMRACGGSYSNDNSTRSDVYYLANESYLIADAMLKARKEANNG